ncbi:MAG: hypothetical protein ACTHN0_14395 [Aquihabitans sp.]
MTDPANPGDADRAWFRTSIDPILDADPIPDAWSSIEARAQGESPAPAAPEDRTTQVRWLAAAAVLLVLAAVTAVLTSSRHDGDGDAVRAGAGAATGWYLPRGLPDGWRLTTAMVTDGAPCDVASQRWKARPDAAEPDGTRSAIELRYTSCLAPEEPANGTPGPALGGHVSASTIGPSTEDPSWEVIRWEGDGHWALTGEGVDQDRLIEAAKAIVADPASDDAPLAGYAATGAGGGQEADPDAAPAVAVNLASPEGWQVQYELVVSGDGPQLTPMTTEEEHPLEQQPLELARRGTRPLDRTSPRPAMSSGYLFGAWPGADVLIHEGVYPVRNDLRPPTAAQSRQAVDLLAASLHPATASEWRTFLATATDRVTDRALLSADTLDQLGTTPPTSTSAPLGGASSTTSTSVEPTPTTTAAEPPNGPVTSGSGSSTPNEQEQPSFTELDQLDIRLELASGTIHAGSPVAGTLVLRNPTDSDIELTECSEGHTSWGLVPADDPDGELPPAFMIDCFETSMLTVPAGKTVRYRKASYDPGRDRFPFAAQRPNPKGVTWPRLLGTLAGGRYLAVAEIPGRTSTLRLSVPVTVADPPCETTDATVTSYANLTVAQARAKAESDGDDVRIISGPGSDGTVDQDLRCNRINVDLSQDGVVTNALRY